MAQKYIPVPLRRSVRARASERCEYCHIVAEKHGGKTEESNLALACALDNQRKGSDLASIDPDTGLLVPLFHPRQDRWSDHFRLVGALVEPLTPIGRVTVRLLQLNQPERLEERALLLRLGLLPFVQEPGAGTH